MNLKADLETPESEKNESNVTGEEEKKEVTDSVETRADPLEKAKADLKAAREESAEWQDRFLRKAAEFENFRKRTEKEKVDALVLAKSALLLEFLPIADACERALRSMDKGEDITIEIGQYREGVELLYKQLLDTFVRAGVVPIESEGKPFDPHLHEALSRQEAAEYEEDTVVEELRRGYLFKDKLLRPAQVIVAVPSESKEGEES